MKGLGCAEAEVVEALAEEGRLLAPTRAASAVAVWRPPSNVSGVAIAAETARHATRAGCSRRRRRL